MGRRTGRLSKDVKRLVHDLHYGGISGSKFKERLGRILHKWSYLSRPYQDVGMALQKWARHASGAEFDFEEDEFAKRVWRLADEVDPRIKKDFIEWIEEMQR